MGPKDSQVLDVALAQKHRVLCVDDDPGVLSALRRLLRDEPYEVVIARTAEEAIERLAQGGVSLILTDQRMPGMCGTDLLEQAQKISPGTTRVMLTGYPGSALVSYSLAQGIDWLISKPWNDEALKLTLRQLLRNRENGGSKHDPASADGGIVMIDDFRRSHEAALPAKEKRKAPITKFKLRRTGEEIRAEIVERFEGFPPFFAPALEVPDVLEGLWRQTVSAYLDNPLPALFKEKLLAYLGRFCPSPYGVISHSCGLRGLGMSAPRILALLEEPAPALEIDVVSQLSALSDLPAPLPAWPEPDSKIENGLFRCAVALSVNGAQAAKCRSALRRALGTALYTHLQALLIHVRASHAWMEAHPDLSWRGDPRVVEHLDAIGREEPGLIRFFASHEDRVRAERQRVEDKLLGVISELRKHETDLKRAQDGLENTVQERTSQLTRLNAEMVMEIIDRKRVEEELREMNVILENAVEGISRLDPHGRYLTVNKAHAMMLGYVPEELLGREWTVTIHPEDLARVRTGIDRMRTLGKAEVEARGVRKDGAIFHMQVLMIRALDKEDNYIGHYGFMKDISERKKAEEERDRMSAQLLQGQKMQAIGQLSAGIAHEINNPVGYILSNLTTLGEYFQDLSKLLKVTGEVAEKQMNGDDTSTARSKLEKLRREIKPDFILEDFGQAVRESKQGAERIRDIVKSLREFSHVDVGQPGPADLNKCLEDSLRICWNEIKYKASVQRDYGNLPLVPCHPQRLGQVFVNLLVNAAQAIRDRGEIRVSTGIEAGEAVVRIHDTGCGIPGEDLKKLFEPFFTTKPVGKGTGLGLHVAYKIVHAHGGRIEVASKVGEGTEFKVRLPLAKDVKGPI